MKITHLNTHQVGVSRRGNWLFVQVHTDDGLIGLGEATHTAGEAQLLHLLEHAVAPVLHDQNPADVEALCFRVRHLGAAQPGAAALSAVEQALWDLKGQAAGQPIWRLLGGRLRPRVWVYANINRATWERTPGGFAAQARQAVAAGFRAVKLAAFDGLPRQLETPEAYAAIEQGIDAVLAVREAVGPQVQVLLDCHSHFDAQGAIRVARRLEPARLFWYEDPVPRADIDGLARVHDSIEQPVAAGETFFGRALFWELFRRRAIDIAMPDVKYCGGIAELRRIAAMAEPAHIQVAPHNPSGPVATAASAHAVAGLPNFTILEYAFGEVEWRPTLVTPAEAFVDGFYIVPDAPGLGVKLDEATLRAHAV